MDDENVLESFLGGACRVNGTCRSDSHVCRRIPVEDPEEETGSTDPDPVLTTIDETGFQILVTSFKMPSSFRKW